MGHKCVWATLKDYLLDKCDSVLHFTVLLQPTCGEDGCHLGCLDEQMGAEPLKHL